MTTHVIEREVSSESQFEGKNKGKGIGKGTAFGAATIVNAMPSGRGAAFSVGLRTFAEVEVREDPSIEVEILGGINERKELASESFRATLESFGLKHGGMIRTRSEIPIARGMKSSSAASNAIILATLDAIGETMDDIDIIKIGVAASLRAKVSLTGAFDDACASYLGGLHMTDNKKRVIIMSHNLEPMSAIFLVPEERRYSGEVNRTFISQYAGVAEMAMEEALAGRHWQAMLLNGLAMAHAFKINPAPIVAAMKNGAIAAGLCGKGPAICAVSTKEFEGQIVDGWGVLGFSIIRTEINSNKARMGV